MGCNSKKSRAKNKRRGALVHGVGPIKKVTPRKIPGANSTQPAMKKKPFINLLM